MSAPDLELLRRRAGALAIVILTRRDDVGIERNAFGYGPDLLVSLRKDGAFTGRQFGIELKTRMQGARPPRVDRASLRRERERYRDLPFPVCSFLFFMEDDGGYWRWIVEPRVEDGAARLEVGSRLTFEELTDAAVDRLVREVNAWYDARASAPAGATGAATGRLAD